ncbi:formate dehydrogenase accessory protein FdhE domain-containing protein [Methylobacterium oryzae CBMB20]
MARFFKRRPAAPAADQTSARATPPEPRRRDFSDLKPDPDKIGIAGSVPFVRLPDPATLFADRTARLREAAPGHPLEAYLRFVAEVARAQAVIQAKGPPVAAPDAADRALRIEHGMPPLSRHGLEADPGFDDGLLALLAELDLTTAPEASSAARETLRAASGRIASTSPSKCSRGRCRSTGSPNACSCPRPCRSASPSRPRASTPRS